jgi:hypothetical protein
VSATELAAVATSVGVVLYAAFLVWFYLTKVMDRPRRTPGGTRG